jgi:hypothetical protein
MSLSKFAKTSGLSFFQARPLINKSINVHIANVFLMCHLSMADGDAHVVNFVYALPKRLNETVRPSLIL